MLALIPIVLATAACSSSGQKASTSVGPTEQPASQAVPTPTTTAAAVKDFTSKRYGFRVTLAKDWTETDAQADWNGKQLQGTESPEFANFTHTGFDRTLVTAAVPVTKGMPLAAWRAAMVRAAPSVCTESPSATKTTLGGEPALTWTATCSDGYNVHKLAAVHGNRGYMIFLASVTSNGKAADRSVFDSIRRSFRFGG